MLDCKHAARLLSQQQDRRLTPRERLQLRLHLMICPHCRRYGKQMDFIRDNVREWAKRQNEEK